MSRSGQGVNILYPQARRLRLTFKRAAQVAQARALGTEAERRAELVWIEELTSWGTDADLQRSWTFIELPRGEA